MVCCLPTALWINVDLRDPFQCIFVDIQMLNVLNIYIFELSVTVAKTEELIKQSWRISEIPRHSVQHTSGVVALWVINVKYQYRGQTACGRCTWLTHRDHEICGTLYSAEAWTRGRHFDDDILKYISINWKYWIWRCLLLWIRLTIDHLGSGKGLVPSGSNPLPNPKLVQIPHAILRH